MLVFRRKPDRQAMFNFFRKKSEANADAVLRDTFAAGLDAGIKMVRIAAGRVRDGDVRSLDDVADIMQQALDEFVAEK
jgi:hypothetical protein